jgi:hypothetical protein
MYGMVPYILLFSFLFSAAGELLPPMVLFRQPNNSVYPVWGEDGPTGSVFGACKSGWFNRDEFNKWFEQVPVPYCG